MDKHLSKGDRLFMFSVYAFLIIFTASILLPLIYVIMTSFAPARDYYNRGILPHTEFMDTGGLPVLVA